MSVEDVKVPYEILVRFDENGAPSGAHVQYRRRVTLDGEVLKEEIQDAQPIDLDGFPTSAIMSDATKIALAKIDSQASQIALLTEQLDRANELLSSLSAEPKTTE